MNVGTALRLARQRAGLSREQVAQRTKIQLAKIEALETSAFERLPDGIYLDGIVRAYAHAVGLDGDETVQRLHLDLALRESEAADSRRPTASSEPTDVTYANDVVAYAEIDPFDPGFSVAHDRGPMAPPLPEPGFEIFRGVVPTSTAPPRRTGRFVLAVVVLLAASVLGGYLYESRRSETAPAALVRGGTGGAGEPGAGATGATGAAGAGGVAAPYSATRNTDSVGAIESAGAASSAQTTAPAVPATSGPRPPMTPVAPAPVRPAAPVSPATRAPLPTASPVPAAIPAPVPSAAPATPAGPTTPAPPAPSAPPAADLSGIWTLATRIETSDYRDFEGLQLGYRLELQLDGSRVTGTGVKLFENGRKLGSASQTPILLRGTIDGSRLTLTFTEQGLRRTSGGKMILDITDDGVLRGRFSSDAARSGGIVEARRQEG